MEWRFIVAWALVKGSTNLRANFSEEVLRHLLEQGHIHPSSRILAVCAGDSDFQLLTAAGLTNVVLSNLDVQDGVVRHRSLGQQRDASWVRQDVHALNYADETFDLTFVSDGLHHCHSPHTALTEMYRVASHGVVVIESRDSLAVRVARRLSLTGDFEVNSRLLETRLRGGTDFGPVPNFIYRWTEREFEKTISSYAPHTQHHFEYFHGVSLPIIDNTVLRFLTARAAGALAFLAPRQGNTFAMVALKGALKDYLQRSRDAVNLRPGISGAHQVWKATHSTRETHRVPL